MLYPTLVECVLLPAVGAFTRSKFSRLASRMRRFDRLPPERARQQQWESVRRILADAYEQVPFYRDRFAEAGLHPADIRTPDDLERLPPVTRQEITANFPDRITATEGDRSKWRFAATSGTTSQRMIVIQDFGKREGVRAAAMRSFTFSGLRLGSPYLEIPPDVCNIQCGLKREPEPPLLNYLKATGLKGWTDRETWSTVRGLVERQVVYRRAALPSFDARGTCQPEEVLDGYLREIAAHRPAMLKALPAYLLALARHIRRKGSTPPPVGEIRPMGSALAPSARRIIADAFGCRVLEDYGSAELGSIGCECEPGNGLHLFSDLFYVEFVRDGRRVGPGELGRLLVTDLTNRAMPLIRYDIGDVGLSLPEPCDCGRGTMRFKVLGRVHDAIVSPQGRVVTEHEVSDFLYEYRGVEWFQLVQRAESQFDLQVVDDRDSPLPLEDLSRDLAAFLGGNVRVSARRVRSIPPENGGKFRFAKSLKSHAII
jgi:phenylacetate-CoA ligase